MTKSELKVDWATHEAAKYACENWHYSKSLPVGKMVKIGAWEGGKFIGVVIFAWGMNRNLGSPYGLGIGECCELVRVALTKHKTQVSRIIKIAIAFLKSKSPGLKMIVSFADPEQGHSGGIYQAGNWVYAGRSSSGFEWVLNGKRLNKRAYTGQQFGGGSSSVARVPKGAIKRKICGKHRYLMPLDGAMRKQIQSLAKPYPKRVTSADSGTLGNPAEKGRCDSDRNASETT